MANIHDVNESLQVQPSVKNAPTPIALSQGENGRSLQFRMVGTTIPSGSNASLSGTKPDGVVYSKAGTVDGNTVTFQEDVQLTAVAGAWDAKIRIVNGGDSVATALIRFIIDPDPVAAGAVPSDSQLDGIVAECRLYAENAKSSAYGSPLTASTAADMLDTTKVYVYTGEETGYTEGHWYYWDGTAWTDGGVYNSIAIQTDKTLTLPDHAADAKTTGDTLALKANTEGEIAMAKALVGGKYTLDQSSYHYRQSPDAGALDEKIVGGTLAWNQLAKVVAISWTNYAGVQMSKVDDATIHITGTVTSFAQARAFRTVNAFPPNHVYLIITGSSLISGAYIGNGSSVGTNGIYLTNPSTSTESAVVNIIAIGTDFGSAGIDVKPRIYDLTTCFGTTIADYIYSLEQSSAGAGVDWVRQYIDLDTYHEYCEPALKSVEGLVSRDVVGFNQWDEEWESGQIYSSGQEGADPNSIRSKNYNKCFPNTNYYSRALSATLLCWYDADKNFIGRNNAVNTLVTSPSNAHYFRITCPSYGTTYKNDICINLSDPSRNGTYEHYEKHSYPLDSSVTLRGVPKLVTDHIEFDGDRYYADGSVARMYGERAYQSGDESLANAITDGTTTVYKLTTPTTETAQPYQSPQLAGSTEEYVTTGVVPVGHESKYYEDVAKKVSGLPKDFSTLIAPTEATFTATRNYTVGSFVIVNNQLYKVTSAISSGGTITPNSNVTATTIMAEILALA